MSNNKWDWNKKVARSDTLHFNWKWYATIKCDGKIIMDVERKFDDIAEYPFLASFDKSDESTFYFISDYDYFRFCATHWDFIRGYGAVDRK